MAEKKSLLRRLFGLVGGILDFVRKAVFIVFLLISLGVTWIIYKGGPPIKVDDGIALVLVPFGQIVDQDETDPRARLADEFLGEDPSVTVLGNLLTAIDSAATDKRIKALFLKLDTGFYAGQAQMEELVAAIQRFKLSDKPVYAYAPDYGQQAYFLAAAADEIFVDPLGLVFFQGYENYPLYYREALDRLGVTVNVFRVGEFKSAVEPFLRDSMSDAAKRNAQGWLDDLWMGWREQVAQARGLSAQDLQTYSDNFAQLLQQQEGDTALTAKAANLVDHVMDLHELREYVGELVGMDEEHGSFRQIDHARYLRAVKNQPKADLKIAEKPRSDPAFVSVVTVQGNIVVGESAPGYAGGDSIRRLIDDARRDESSKALVLRVDSPGGSVFASEQMRRAVLRYQASGRPVVVSMASVAASGGYWISMDADSILAHATTITGSIGVFGMVPTFEKSLDKLGISSDGVGTTRWSGGLTPLRPLSKSAREGLQSVVEKDYRLFIGSVAKARDLSLETTDSIAQGQVWSGQHALDIGLVDELGDFDAAITKAASLAGIEDFEVQPMRPPMDLRMQFLDRFSSIAMPSGLSRWIGQWLQQIDSGLRRWSDPRAVYADCLCDPRH
ncbi:MAG: signal peptide peptidase SppA [Oceanococcus sp.]